MTVIHVLCMCHFEANIFLHQFFPSQLHSNRFVLCPSPRSSCVTMLSSAMPQVHAVCRTLPPQPVHVLGTTRVACMQQCSSFPCQMPPMHAVLNHMSCPHKSLASCTNAHQQPWLLLTAILLVICGFLLRIENITSFYFYLFICLPFFWYIFIYVDQRIAGLMSNLA